MISNRLIFQFIISLYIIFIISLFLPIANFGIIPRTLKGLLGIITSPILHGNFYHIISNTLPLVIFLFVLNKFYPKKSLIVIISVTLICGILVWLFARNANHIGASGLIYGLAGFLIANGFVERKFIPLAISIGIITIYGSMIWGVLPSVRSYISWESHLFGAIAGIFMAFHLKDKKTPFIPQKY